MTTNVYLEKIAEAKSKARRATETAAVATAGGAATGVAMTYDKKTAKSVRKADILHTKHREYNDKTWNVFNRKSPNDHFKKLKKKVKYGEALENRLKQSKGRVLKGAALGAAAAGTAYESYKALKARKDK